MKEGETLEVPEFDDIYASSDVCNVMSNFFFKPPSSAPLEYKSEF